MTPYKTLARDPNLYRHASPPRTSALAGGWPVGGCLAGGRFIRARGPATQTSQKPQFCGLDAFPPLIEGTRRAICFPVEFSRLDRWGATGVPLSLGWLCRSAPPPPRSSSIKGGGA